MRLNNTLIYLYILVGLMPYFGTADKMHPQTLYISILNIISIGVILYQNGIPKTFKKLLKISYYKQFVFYFVFLIFAILSVLQAINEIQSMITLAEILSQFFAFLILIYLVSNLKNVKSFFINSIVILCVIELFSTIYPYLADIFRLGYPINRSLEYRGVSGSVNIISYLLLMKLPFIYYLSVVKKKYRIFFILISVSILYSIIVIHQTRSAIILSFLVSIFILLVFIYNSFIDKKGKLFSLKSSIIVVVLPIFLSLFLSNVQASKFNRTLNVQDRLSSINLDEYSTNSRLRYYSQAIESIISNPLGIGIGNWQIVSIDKDKENIEAYIIPYHAHNDFLELSAETSLVGGIAYYMIIVSTLFFLLKKIIQSIQRRKPLEYDLLFFTVLGIWIVDSMFNFPAARVLQQITLMYIIAVIINYYKFKTLKLPKMISTFALCVLFISLPFVLFSSIRLVKSSFDQRVLLSHYNLADYTIPLEVVDEMDMEYSDLTVTGIPMKSLKGFFYMKAGLHREAIDLFNEGTSRNPYLYFSESYKSFSHLNLKNYDSAYYFSDLAFNKIPGNVVHFANLALSHVYRRDSVGLKKAYTRAIHKKELHDEIYLTAMADIIDSDQENFALDKFNLNIQSGNDNLKRSYFTLKIGRNNVFEADKFHQIGEYYFKEEDFETAEDFFRRASNLNPYELVYKENLANTNLKLGRFGVALNILNELIIEDGSKSIKVKYLRILAYLNLQDFENACLQINEIKNEPLVRKIELERFCN